MSGDRGSPSSTHTNTTIKEEIEDYAFGELRRSSSHNSIGNNSLFSSPSMPNISLSAHHIANSVSLINLIFLNSTMYENINFRTYQRQKYEQHVQLDWACL